MTLDGQFVMLCQVAITARLPEYQASRVPLAHVPDTGCRYFLRAVQVFDKTSSGSKCELLLKLHP